MRPVIRPAICSSLSRMPPINRMDAFDLGRNCKGQMKVVEGPSARIKDVQGALGDNLVYQVL